MKRNFTKCRYSVPTDFNIAADTQNTVVFSSMRGHIFITQFVKQLPTDRFSPSAYYMPASARLFWHTNTPASILTAAVLLMKFHYSITLEAKNKIFSARRGGNYLSLSTPVPSSSVLFAADEWPLNAITSYTDGGKQRTVAALFDMQRLH